MLCISFGGRYDLLMAKYYNGVPKNKVKPSWDTGTRPIWNAEYIHVKEADEYMAKILIYDNYEESNFFPIANDKVILFKKSGFQFAKIDDVGIQKVFSLFKKVYSKRYKCTAYICRIKEPPQVPSLIGYLEEQVDDNNNKEITPIKKDKIKLGIEERLARFIEDEVNKMKENFKISGATPTQADIDETTTKAFQKFYDEGHYEEEEKSGKSNEPEKNNFFNDKDKSVLEKTIESLKKQVNELKQGEDLWIKIKKHDGSMADRSRVILELRRILKDETLAAVKEGYKWNNANHSLEKRTR